MKELNEVTRTAVLDFYNRNGLAAADIKVRELLVQCETMPGNSFERGAIKGELSEIALEYHLLHWFKQSRYMMLIKSLCIKSKTSNATAEIDILLATPCKVYLFECKSFKGTKVLSKECFLEGDSSQKDVYDQSKYHLQILEQYLADCRFVKRPVVPPYQLILFELSSNTVTDLREQKWKDTIPYLTLDTIDSWFKSEFAKSGKVIWNYEALCGKLLQLNKTSKNMFKFHMHKILGRRK